ncbi:FMN-binding protein [Acidiferrimicrobium sp. IK]|uniref:FMN-binding protein n=1 Tax=Acidiferrimicrobium sp. IK TaxID=2871700 RepID=UPI0021CB01A1|nr:FMN-binding protein [Acidiferrimicrobium sp. IK]MCU4186254.1 FMN-binding protein [Acidiferrimicrobium sp. IK]
MRRAPFVIAGTIVGVAGVLAYPTHPPRLVVPSSSSSSSSSSAAAANAGGGGGSSAASSAPASGPPTTPGTAPSTAATTAPAVRSAVGADTQYPYGDLAVEVKATGNHITDLIVTRLNDGGAGQSEFIDHQAIPLLRRQVLAAQTTNINGVSGATYTSQAYVDSVQSALDKLGIK